jgi:hypothetical protein
MTPPQGLVVLLRSLVPHGVADTLTRELWLINRAYAAGADQELEACCEWVDWKWSGIKSRELRATRRPKPPSLKEQALKALKVLPTPEGQVTLDITDLNTIRRALEVLPND